MTTRKRASERKAPWGATKERQRHATTKASWADEISAQLVAACHGKQKLAVQDDGRRVAVLTARGGGKTTVLVARLIRKCARKKRATCLYFGPTRERAKELIWEKLKSVCEQLQIKMRFYEGSMTATFVKTGSRILVRGCESNDDVEKFRGQSFDEVQVDESQSVRDVVLQNMVLRIFGPRLGDRDGCIVLAGTPGLRRSGFWYEVTRPGSDRHRPYIDREQAEFKGWTSWSSHWWTMEDGAAEVPAIAKLWADALILKADEKWTDRNPVWLREYKGLWAEDNTEAIYSAYRSEVNQWSPKMVVRGSVRVAKLPDLGFTDWLYGYGGDMGHSDPFALNVFAWSPSDALRRIWHVFGFERRKMHGRVIAQLLLGESDGPLKVRSPDAPLGVVGATGWPAVRVADMAGNGNMVLEDLAVVYGFRFEPAKKADKYGAFEVTNGAFADGRLFLMEGSRLAEEVTTLQWTTNDAGQLVEPKGLANHNSDSMVYTIPVVVKMFDGAEDERPPPAGAGMPDAHEDPPEDLGDPPGELELAGRADEEQMPDDFPFDEELDRDDLSGYG